MPGLMIIAYVISAMLGTALGISILGALIRKNPADMTEEELLGEVMRNIERGARRDLGSLDRLIADYGPKVYDQITKQKIDMMSEGFTSGEEEAYAATKES